MTAKTPDEIKKGLECCQYSEAEPTDCAHCPYYLTDNPCDVQMIKDALAHIRQLEEHIRGLPKMVPEWISTEDRLPKPFVSVIVHMPEESPCPTVHEGYLCPDNTWYSAHFVRQFDEVTHWMPLPEPPKEGE